MKKSIVYWKRYLDLSQKMEKLQVDFNKEMKQLEHQQERLHKAFNITQAYEHLPTPGNKKSAEFIQQELGDEE